VLERIIASRLILNETSTWTWLHFAILVMRQTTATVQRMAKKVSNYQIIKNSY